MIYIKIGKPARIPIGAELWCYIICEPSLCFWRLVFKKATKSEQRLVFLMDLQI